MFESPNEKFQDLTKLNPQEIPKTNSARFQAYHRKSRNKTTVESEIGCQN